MTSGFARQPQLQFDLHGRHPLVVGRSRTAMTSANQSKTSKEVAVGWLRAATGRLHMNATATIAPAPQYMRALERANQVRLARAELKRRVAIDQIDAADVILACPWEAQSMAIADLLMSQRRWGQTRCRKFLAQIPMSEKKTIGTMTERQRRTLATLLCSTERGRAITATPWVTDSLMTA
jgi:hypothetical protein